MPMSNHNYPRRLLDDAIDRAVHEMMQAEPRPGFRGRVLGKLKEPAGARRSWVPRLLVPAGVVMALIIAGWLRPAPPVLAPSPDAVAQRAPETAPPVATEKLTPENPKPSVAPREARRQPAARDVSVPFSFGPRTGRATATSVSNPAGGTVDAPEPPASPVTVDPAVRQIAPLIQPPPIPLRPIELKDIILMIPPRILP
jgi:hypothetical protein